ncbi:hypothetical protein [Pontibacter deserti]|uniref:hypothetical protein n=1 Tax=Pontibacter sp. KCTC 32443 TaxID=2764721 RepID=UPI00164D4E1F|nr:hypothetical protein [Pontibacter sp. KCTC 32443]
MKYALILHSEFHHPNFWVCFALANTMESLQKNLCYDPTVQLMLHKGFYKGNPVSEIKLPSCGSGSFANFIVCELEAPKGMDIRFEL